MTSGVTEPIALEKVMSGVTELLEGGDRDKVWLALGSDPALASRLGENGVGLRNRQQHKIPLTGYYLIFSWI